MHLQPNPLAGCKMAKRVSLRPGLLCDAAGVTVVEFALVLPVFLMVLVGSLDLAQMVYAKAVLDGVVEKASRDSALETGDTTLADGVVRQAISQVLPGSRVSVTRKNYFDFTNANRGEELDDVNGDGECSPNEAYTDLNNNDHWDKSLGADGNGGANDVIVYTVNVSYEPAFALPLVPLDWSTRDISATAVKRNQPFGRQSGNYSERPKTC